MTEFESSLNDLLVDTFNSILKYEEASLRAISGASITIAEAHTIEAISKLGDSTTVSQIATLLDVAMPTITVAIKKLESKGLVAKVPCVEDRRRFIITLTQAGQKINRAHSIFHKKMVKNVSRNFTDEEKDILLTGIQKLSVFFKGKVEAKKWL